MAGYREVAAKIDAFFTRVEARHGEDMQCATGCSDCCHTKLSVTRVEAESIRTEVAGWDPARLAALREVGPHCAALDDTGRCKIYEARPFVCRSHGAPIRMRERSIQPHSPSGVLRAAPAQRSLPIVQSCFRNFTRVEPAADCILDQTTLSALTLAVNAGDTERLDLAELLASLC